MGTDSWESEFTENSAPEFCPIELRFDPESLMQFQHIPRFEFEEETDDVGHYEDEDEDENEEEDGNDADDEMESSDQISISTEDSIEGQHLDGPADLLEDLPKDVPHPTEQGSSECDGQY